MVVNRFTEIGDKLGRGQISLRKSRKERSEEVSTKKE